MAVDFTIITPTRASASPSSSSTTTLLDQAAKQKQQKSRQQCEAAGWKFQPFVADTYGALHAEAREFVSNFISRYHSKVASLDEAEAGRAVWSTISAAVVSRAAQQLCRLALTDAPFGLPLRALQLRTPRLTSSTLPFPHLPHDMGTNNHLRPSQDEEEVTSFVDVARDAADSSDCNQSQKEAPHTVTRVNLPFSAGCRAPIQVPSSSATSDSLRSMIVIRYALNSDEVQVFLAPRATLNDLQDMMCRTALSANG